MIVTVFCVSMGNVTMSQREERGIRNILLVQVKWSSILIKITLIKNVYWGLSRRKMI